MEAGVKAVLDSVIIRFAGEICLKKAWTRRLFESRLIDNMKCILKRDGISYEEIVRRHGRLYLRTTSAVEAAHRLARIFGVSSVSPSLEASSSRFEDVIDGSMVLARCILAENNSFAVKCRRIGKHSYSSIDVCVEVGQRIMDESGEKLGLKVNLKNPDVSIGVEVRGKESFVFSEVIQGVGGMPFRTQSRALGLLTNGVDSAVACWLIMKRGCPIVPVFFDLSPFTDEATSQIALDHARVLFNWAGCYPKRMHIIKHGLNLKEIMEECPGELTCLICKRLMYRIAELFAESVKAEGIVTGESIWGQACQNMRKLRMLSEVTQNYPVLRPLLGFDRNDIEAIARKMGINKYSNEKEKGCSVTSTKPATFADLDEVLKAEKKLKIKEMIERTIGQAQKVTL